MITHERTKMFVINKETYKNNDIEVLVNNNGTLWLNENMQKKNYTIKIQLSLKENTAQTILGLQKASI